MWLGNHTHIHRIFVVFPVDDKPHVDAFPSHHFGNDVVQPPPQDIVHHLRSFSQRQDVVAVIHSSDAIVLRMRCAYHYAKNCNRQNPHIFFVNHPIHLLINDLPCRLSGLFGLS